MSNPVSKTWRLVNSSTTSKTVSIILTLVILSAIPATLTVLKRNQDLRQYAASDNLDPNKCPQAPAKGAPGTLDEAKASDEQRKFQEQGNNDPVWYFGRRYDSTDPNDPWFTSGQANIMGRWAGSSQSRMATPHYMGGLFSTGQKPQGIQRVGGWYYDPAKDRTCYDLSTWSCAENSWHRIMRWTEGPVDNSNNTLDRNCVLDKEINRLQRDMKIMGKNFADTGFYKIDQPPAGTQACQGTNLGGILSASPSAAIFKDQLFVFARGSQTDIGSGDHYALYYKKSTDGIKFGDWQNLGGTLLDRPLTSVTSDKLTVGATGSDNAFYNKTTTDGQTFGDWQKGEIPNASSASVITFKNKTLSFRRSSDNALCLEEASGGATLKFSIILDGVGVGGDSANPKANSKSNKNPLVRSFNDFTIMAFDSQNTQEQTTKGTLNYNESSGKYEGSATLTNLKGQSHIIKVRVRDHLIKTLPGIQQIASGSATYTMPEVNLVAGDINNDNVIDLLDYNILLGCYSDTSPAKACNPDQKASSDLNYDGKVNLTDFTLFERELSVQNGN